MTEGNDCISISDPIALEDPGISIAAQGVLDTLTGRFDG